MNGAGAIAQSLKLAGVDVIFSLSGNQIMPIYDACIDARLRIVHVRHEAAAVYMADAYAQLTGGIGVALLTAGPGFANGLSPLCSARAAESPVVLISGDAPVSGDGNGAFQEMDQIGVTKPIVKLALRPMTSDALVPDLTHCVRTALSGRRGPVHLALPFDLLNAEHSAPFDDLQINADLVVETQLLDERTARRIAERVGRSDRPLILVGPQHNRSRSPKLIAALEEAFNIPVIAMESPRGLRDPALGAFAEVLGQADLVISIGKAIDFTLGFARPPAIGERTPMIIIDPDSALHEQARKHAEDRIIIAAQADAGAAMEALIAIVLSDGIREGDPAWVSDVREALSHRVDEPIAGDRATPQQICEAVNRVLAKASDPILICDGGEFGQWAQACCSAPTRVINGVLGAIGGGLCYALAAKIARPDATVAVLMGDGTAGFHFSEFDTAAREGTGFLAIIGNDFRWNAEHQIQLRDYGPDRLIGCELSSVARYDKAAEGFGCHGVHVDKAADLDAAFAAALASGKPACLNVEMNGLAAPTVLRQNQAG